MLKKSELGIIHEITKFDFIGTMIR